ALVGARRCSPYGMRIAAKLAGSLARVGLTVVSGLARGIDAAAHRGALKAGGRTLAVLANGLAEIYPPEHAELAHEVAAPGAPLSRDGARLVETVDDILEELGPLVRAARPDAASPATTARPPAELTLSDHERALLGHLSDQAVGVDELIGRTGLAAAQVLATLS